MGFFFIVLINIFMWALFYLIVSLKLEKSASEFREKRLRSEMDQIIREFNATADRNISLLENRIEQYKRLLNNSGEYSRVDFVVGDEGGASDAEDMSRLENKEIKSEIPVKNDLPETPDVKSLDRGVSPLRQSFAEFLDHAKDKVNSLAELILSRIKPSEPQLKDQGDIIMNNSELPRENPDKIIQVEADAMSTHEDHGRAAIGKSFKDIPPELIREPQRDQEEEATEPGPDQNGLSEEEIRRIVSSGSDKITVVKELYRKGIDPVHISEYTGIPDGEVKLIVNLSTGN